MTSHIDRSVHSDSTYACVHTYRIYIRRAGSRAAVCGIHPSIHPEHSDRHQSSRDRQWGHTYSCDQLVPKGRVLLAVIKPYVSRMYVLFVYKVKLKGSTMQKLMTSTTKEQEGLLKIHANLFMHANTLHLYTIHSILYRTCTRFKRILNRYKHV